LDRFARDALAAREAEAAQRDQEAREAQEAEARLAREDEARQVHQEDEALSAQANAGPQMNRDVMDMLNGNLDMNAMQHQIAEPEILVGRPNADIERGDNHVRLRRRVVNRDLAPRRQNNRREQGWREA
jgi:hypothetical protein